MLKFIIIILGTTSIGWASKYPYYNSNYNSNKWDTQDYKTYDPKKEAAELLAKKIKILNELTIGAERNQQICDNRQECLMLDQQLLQQLQEKYRQSYEVHDLFSNLSVQLKQAAEKDIVVTEWDVYNSLSESAKQQYRQGVRINPLHQAVSDKRQSYAAATSHQAAKFNLDDLKIYLLQQIEKNHQRCGSRDSCLQSDLKLVQEVSHTLQKDNPDRAVFEQLADIMQDSAFKQSFETVKFYKMYGDYVVKQHTLLYKSPERIQWNELVKTIRPGARRDAQIINQAEVKEKSKPENQMKQHLKAKSEDLAKGVLDQVLGGSGAADQKRAGGLFGGLFGR